MEVNACDIHWGTEMSYEWASLTDLQSMLIEMLDRMHSGQVTRLWLHLDGDTIVLRGEVGSEGCRGDAKRLALAFDDVFKVKNELVVAGFLEPASDPTADDFFGHGNDSDGSAGCDDEGVPPRDGNVDGLSPDGDGETYVRHGDDNRRDANPERHDYRSGIITKSFGRIEGPGIEYGSVDPIGASTPELTEVRRHPSIETVGELAAGLWIDVAVDLLIEGKDEPTAISIGSFPSDWTEIPITVHAFAPWASEMTIETQVVMLSPAGSSGPARFRLRVAEGQVAGAPALTYFSFLHGTRGCGHATKDLATSTIVRAEHDVAVPVAATLAPAEFKVEPDAAGPTLSVSIFADVVGRQTWMWDVRVPGGTWSGAATIDLGNAAAEFAEKLLRSCPDLPSDEFRRAMAGVGERLWHAAPAAFRTGYLEWRQKLGGNFPIQFLTDDPHVPWEMMKPNATNLDHLFLEHPVARWPLTGAQIRRHRLPGGELLSFVPNYASPEALPSAAVEGAWICSELAGIAMPATRAALLRVFDGKHPAAVGLIHFAGHGSVHTDLLNGGIEMEDKPVGVGDVFQASVTLGETDWTLVVLNACESGAGSKLLGMNTGWGAAIANRGFGGLIAPLWEVQDEIALAMVKAALPPLLEGNSSLGEAVADARFASRDLSISAFAYLAHGDVMARFPSRR